MALYFNSNNEDDPQTHILIIGVGAYPFISGGSDEKVQTFDGAALMGQLGSPPISANAFYNSVLKLHEDDSWITPLGTVEVLVSANPQTAGLFGGQQLEPATIANVKAAYWRWRDRCDRNEGNTALFFFCGHGLDNGEQYLLTEDFGQNPRSPWDGTFTFDMTRRAFAGCRAKTQIFLIDACRQLTNNMVSTDLPKTPIEAPNRFITESEFSLVQKAAAPNEQAYGIDGQPSFYTQALINALHGHAASNDTGEWIVSTGTLASKMTTFLKQIAENEGYDQRCISTTSNVTDLLRLTVPPEVSFTITCAPQQALIHASLSYMEVNTEIGDSREPFHEPWNVNIAAGFYKVGASFAEGGYKSKPRVRSVIPPYSTEEIKCI